MSSWKIIMPTAASNIVFNPSAERETPANWAAVDGATITHSATYARFGDYCYKIVPGGTSRGISLTTATMANAIHYVTFYVYSTITGVLYVSLDAGANGVNNVASIIGGASGGWVRYGFAVAAAQANGNATVRIYNTANETWHVDAIQVEQSSYYTTYIDGNRGESPIYGENTGNLYTWNGHRHASTSTRDAQERGGGRVMDLQTDYGIRVLQQSGTGMPPVSHNLQGLALQPGEAFQSTKVLSRRVTLSAELHGTSVATYHGVRKDLIDLIKPDGVRGAQPFVLGYSGANSGKTVYCRFRYADGLGVGGVDGGSFTTEAHIPITLLAVDPFWIEDNRETAALGFVQTLDDVNRVMARINGVWQELGTGFNNTCQASAYDPTTGRVYFGGDFTTANGVTVNRICYWNPTSATFVAMDSGVNSSVNSIAIAPNGDVWISGLFTTVGAGATAAKGFAMWDLSGSSWSVPTATTTTWTRVSALAIDSIGNVYGTGTFTNFGGVAACDGIFKYSPAGAFTGLGTGLSGGAATGQSLAVGLDGTTIYVGGSFTSGNGVTLSSIGYWNGTTFVAMGGGVNAAVTSIALARNGNIYAGGTFTASVTPAISMSGIGMWNGTGWAPLSNGITGTQISFMHFGSDGLLYVAGNYTGIGPFTTGWPAVWNGSNWQLLDISSTAAAPVFYTFLVTPNGDLYIGHDTATIDTIVGDPTTDIVSTNTVSVFPNFTILGPTTANTITLISIQNLSSDQILRFNLVINTEERMLLSLQPGAKRMASDWRGILPGQPLPTSDFANFKLLPTRADGAATNTIVTFVTGTTTGSLFLMHWVVAHWSLDGPAA